MNPDDPRNDPAGRLHEWLARFDEDASGTSRSCATTWERVFNLPQESPLLTTRVADVARLITDIQRALEALGNTRRQRGFETLLPQITFAFNIASPRFHETGLAQSAVSPSAQAYLDAISGVLSDRYVQSKVPPEEEVESLIEQVRGLRDDVLVDDGISVEVRSLILRRLTDIETALTTLDLRGPEGVQDACERLVAAILLTTKDDTAKPLPGRILAWAGQAWKVFSAAGTLQENGSAWEAILGSVVRGELPPGPS